MNSKTIIYTVLTFVTLNIIVLYWFIYSINQRVSEQLSRQPVDLPANQSNQANEEGNVIERNVTFIGPEQTCADCPQRIADLEEQVATLQSGESAKPVQQTKPSAGTTLKETFVPLGGGETSENDWIDIAGVSAYVDTSQYPTITSARFEGSIIIPTGQGMAYIRLFNSTDKHPVWFSEVSTESSTPFLFQSDPIRLDEGNKLYTVQMKNTLKVRSVVENARIRILLK